MYSFPHFAVLSFSWIYLLIKPDILRIITLVCFVCFFLKLHHIYNVLHVLSEINIRRLNGLPRRKKTPPWKIAHTATVQANLIGHDPIKVQVNQLESGHKIL